MGNAALTTVTGGIDGASVDLRSNANNNHMYAVQAYSSQAQRQQQLRSGSSSVDAFGGADAENLKLQQAHQDQY